ncbi:DNA polymerase I [Desulfonema ishimotonii]|uniref:DNA polymerase I n=1 Tax=Desulfonema ishimotonii TaxID=45657 RepID=A0A401G008_9BACT|nr:DNA polymerase I [Desulfonema ishimotonii]GBC62559.1 DNA polymerase I [Desulfonema ishimotonii]
MPDQKTIYLIDGTAYIYRAFHAIRGGLSNSKGLPTNAALGFTKMLLRLVDDKQPTHMVMCFDAKGKTFRHDAYADYKANRPAMPEDMAVQIPYIKAITRAFNIPLLEMTGYEADDLIGTMSERARAAGFSVVMVTGDKDFLQLVAEDAVIWDPMKDKISDLTTVQEDFGVAPHQIIDIMGFSGDTADNIPGVPGIGPKTAISLISTFGSMAQVYEQVHTITKKKQHENLVRFREQALLSRELVTIRTDVPLAFEPEKFRLTEPDTARLSELFSELEFRQLQERFSAKADRSRKKYLGIFDTDALSELIGRLESAEMFALDTETTALDPMRAELVGLSFAIAPDEAFYIPCGHDYIGAPRQLRLADVLAALKPVLENPRLKKVGQNIKYDWMVLTRHGVRLAGVTFDTMVASYLLNPSKHAHNLDQIAADFLGHRNITYAEVAGKGKNALTFNQVLVEKAIPYACEDADITLMACHVLMPKLAEIGLTRLMETVEMPLIPVLMRMEMTGVCVDRDRLRELSKSFAHQIEQLETEIYAMAGEDFNVRSSQQLGQILFEKLGLPVVKKTRKKTGYSTDVEVLTALAEKHELPALVLRHRTLAKLRSTYADALTELIHPETGRIHTSYNQTVTATGRLSSSGPNLQNIPIRTDEGIEIRKAFIPCEGWTLVAADYSQIELRLLAHYSEDEILIRAFQEEEDIHTRTATEVFQVFPEMITPELRRQAKTINFGIIYGMGAFSLSKELGITRKMAQTYINSYFARYKGVRNFIDKTIEEARTTQQTSTLLGRIRLLPEISSPNNNLRSFAERTAVNTPIQGTAADLIKLAMIRADAALRERNLQSAMLLTVHDELVFEVPPDELDQVKTLVREIMENVWPDLRVPLKVNLDCGANWAEAH